MNRFPLPVAAALAVLTLPLNSLASVDLPPEGEGTLSSGPLLDGLASPAVRLAVPPTLLAIPAEGAVSLHWTPPGGVGAVAGFEVHRACDGCATLLASLGPGERSYLDTTPAGGEPHRYWVVARDLLEGRFPSAGAIGVPAPRIQLPDAQVPQAPRAPTLTAQDVEDLLGLAQGAVEESVLELQDLLQDYATSAARGEFLDPSVGSPAPNPMDGPLRSACLDTHAAGAGEADPWGVEVSAACFEAAFGCQAPASVYLLELINGFLSSQPPALPDCSPQAALDCIGAPPEERCAQPDPEWDPERALLTYLRDAVRLLPYPVADIDPEAGTLRLHDPDTDHADAAMKRRGPCGDRTFDNVVDYSSTSLTNLYGTNQRDLIIANDLDNKVFTYEGDDCVLARGGNDHVEAGPGDDLVFGAGGEDTILGGPGADILFGMANGDHVYGEGGDDTIYGDEQSPDGGDWLDGGDGNDYLRGGGQTDLLFGGAGSDFLRGNTHTDYLYGGPDGDSLYGDSWGDELYGEGGSDNLDGESGGDIIAGGPGHDGIHGRSGDDKIWGESASQLAGDEWDWIDAGSADDRLFTGAGGDWVDLGWGTDYVHAEGGDDVVYGGPGPDEIYGDGGDDQLHGEGGGDWLIGGAWNADAGYDKGWGGPAHDHCQGIEERTSCHAH